MNQQLFSPDEYRRRIGRNIRARRVILGLTQEQMGAMLGRPREYVARLESASTGLSLDEIPWLNSVLKMKNPLALLEDEAFCEVEV